MPKLRSLIQFYGSDAEGAAMVYVGHPDHGPGVVIGQHALDVWEGGSVVAGLGLVNLET